jgi:hypothetical protein
MQCRGSTEPPTPKTYLYIPSIMTLAWPHASATAVTSRVESPKTHLHTYPPRHKSCIATMLLDRRHKEGPHPQYSSLHLPTMTPPLLNTPSNNNNNTTTTTHPSSSLPLPQTPSPDKPPLPPPSTHPPQTTSSPPSLPHPQAFAAR